MHPGWYIAMENDTLSPRYSLRNTTNTNERYGVWLQQGYSEVSTCKNQEEICRSQQTYMSIWRQCAHMRLERLGEYFRLNLKISWSCRQLKKNVSTKDH